MITLQGFHAFPFHRKDPFHNLKWRFVTSRAFTPKVYSPPLHPLIPYLAHWIEIFTFTSLLCIERQRGNSRSFWRSRRYIGESWRGKITPFSEAHVHAQPCRLASPLTSSTLWDDLTQQLHFKHSNDTNCESKESSWKNTHTLRNS